YSARRRDEGQLPGQRRCGERTAGGLQANRRVARLMRHFVAFALIGSTVAASAQAAPWLHARGRVLTMQFAGAPVDKFTAAGHDASAAAAMFKSLCLDTGLNRESAGKHAVASARGLTSAPQSGV